MSEMLNRAKTSILEWRMAICWFILFSVNSLATCLIASLVNCNWSQMDAQAKLLMALTVLANWTGTIMAFVSKAGSRIQQGQPLFPTGDTQFMTQTHSETDSVNLSPTISGPQPSPAAVTETKNRTK